MEQQRGALVGSFAGPAGAAFGALVGFITDATGAAIQYGNAAAIAAAEQAKFNQALRGVTSGNDYLTALESINELSEQFIQDVGTTTEQFTKLTAATTANGISVEDTAEVYRGLAAANLALGGNSERLQGILLATGQVFSKGKVQAEELRGQIGERLPGAFALFAKAVGKTPAELDKALKKAKSLSKTSSNSPSRCLSDLVITLRRLPTHLKTQARVCRKHSAIYSATLAHCWHQSVLHSRKSSPQ